MINNLVSLPDSNNAVEMKNSGSSARKVGKNKSGGNQPTSKTENKNEPSFSQVKKSVEKENESSKPEKEEDVEQAENPTDLVSTVAMVNPETKEIPALSETAVEDTSSSDKESTAIGAVSEGESKSQNINNDAIIPENETTTAEESNTDIVEVASRSFTETYREAGSKADTSSKGVNENQPVEEGKKVSSASSQQKTDKSQYVRESVNSGQEKSGAGDKAIKGNSVLTDNEFTGVDFEKKILENSNMRDFFQSLRGKLNSIKSRTSSDSKSVISTNSNKSNSSITQKGEVEIISPNQEFSGKLSFESQNQQELFKIKDQFKKLTTDFTNLKNESGVKLDTQIKKVTKTDNIIHATAADIKTALRNVEDTGSVLKTENLPVVSKDKFSDFLVSKVKEFFPAATEGKKVLKVVITPPDLGEVKITCEMKKSVLHTNFECSPEAGKAIKSQVPALQKSLSGMGIELGSSNVDTGWHNSSQQENSQRYNNPSSQQNNGMANEEPLTVDEGKSAESKMFNVLI